MTGKQWTGQQREAFSERRAELAVSAAAGSGKTAVLIERVCRAALGRVPGPDGTDISDPAARVSLDRLLAVTFTRAAAAELRERLQSSLAGAARDAAGDAALTAVVRDQLAALPRAQISTIHSFCGEVVRRYGHLRGITHGRVLDEDEASLLRHDLATRFLDARLGPGAGPHLRNLALWWGGSDGVGPDDLSQTRFSGGLRKLMLSLLDFRRSLPDPDRWYEQVCAAPDLDPERFDPAHPVLRQLATAFDDWVAEQERRNRDLAAELAADHPGAIHLTLATRREAQLEQLRFELGWERLAPFIETRLLKNKQDDISYKPNILQQYRRDIPKEDPWYGRIADDGGLKQGLEGWRDVFDRPWAVVARLENETAALTAELWRLATDFDAHYAEYKRGRNVADFDDMQRDALRILAALDPADPGRYAYDAGGRLLPSDAALELRGRFEMVLVDEHQDTNELQDALIDLVTRSAPAGGGGRPRFFVGDLKQSIYTFRQAVPDLFSAARDRLEAAPDDVGRHIQLQQNFRSRPLVLAAINHVFSGLLTRDLGGEDYTENSLEAPDFAVEWSRTAPPELRDRPAELHLVDAGTGGDDGDESTTDEAAGEETGRLEEAYNRLALILRGIHERGELIRDRDGTARPIAWRDMAVLLRSVANRVEMLLGVFARAGIPAYAAGRSGFYERPEVADALALLRVIDNPRQDIPLAAVLRGPAVGLTGAELLTVAHSLQPAPGEPQPGLWDRLTACVDASADNPGLAGRLSRFLDMLAEWRDLARLAPVPELLWRVYADTGLPAAAAAQRGGEQRLANLYRLHDLSRLALGFERQGLARFLRTLELSRRAAGDLGEAPVLTEDQDVVRVMSVHQSKGLEFPLVAVPDMDKRFNLRDLGGDVLWHRTTGIGGRHIDWHGPADDAAEYGLPERTKTLRLHAVQATARRESVAEELRVLYVALTRARERLILTGTIDRNRDGAFRLGQGGADARKWLDWIAGRLEPGLSAAEASGEPAVCGPGDCWRVSLHAPGAVVEQPEKRKRDTTEALAEADRELIRARLNPACIAPGSRQLHAKLTVTRLAHRAMEPEDADLATDAAPPEPAAPAPEVVRPEFLRRTAARKPSPAEFGTAVHLLVAELDPAAEPDPVAVATVLHRLVEAGRLEGSAAALVDPGRIAGSLQEVRGLFEPGRAKLYPELPVALLVRGDDPALLGQLTAAGLSVPEPETLDPADRVYVQGVIDLLVVDDGVATVVDYKTDRGADAGELTRRYRGQLEWYCRMVRALLPGQAVRWAICGLDSAGIVGPVDYSEQG